MRNAQYFKIIIIPIDDKEKKKKKKQHICDYEISVMESSFHRRFIEFIEWIFAFHVSEVIFVATILRA